MKLHSAGILVFRKINGQPQVLITHIGGPWLAKKDIGAWTIPKGLIEPGEEPLQAAKREFTEELSLPIPDDEFIELGDIEQHNNKTVSAWAIEADLDVTLIKSNSFMIEWPPKSGQQQQFPEVDRADWFNLIDAAPKLVKGQAELLVRLANILDIDFDPESGQQASLF